MLISIVHLFRTKYLLMISKESTWHITYIPSHRRRCWLGGEEGLIGCVNPMVYQVPPYMKEKYMSNSKTCVAQLYLKWQYASWKCSIGTHSSPNTEKVFEKSMAIEITISTLRFSICKYNKLDFNLQMVVGFLFPPPHTNNIYNWEHS